ncbi:hypothetical protein A9168_06610 [Macellibacteroides sp. HH-ZS]|nr:hypothetical protein A9168_06610 [Macellibacteroides sp. HH-ZS]
MKRREVFDRPFHSLHSHSYLSLFRTDFICNEANSKLYFLLHGNRFAAKNACPTRGDAPSEVGCFWQSFE